MSTLKSELYNCFQVFISYCFDRLLSEKDLQTPLKGTSWWQWQLAALLFWKSQTRFSCFVYWRSLIFFQPFNNQCSHHVATSQLICRANQLTDFYMMGALVVKRLIKQFLSFGDLEYLSLFLSRWNRLVLILTQSW